MKAPTIDPVVFATVVAQLPKLAGYVEGHCGVGFLAEAAEVPQTPVILVYLGGQLGFEVDELVGEADQSERLGLEVLAVEALELVVEDLDESVPGACHIAVVHVLRLHLNKLRLEVIASGR